VAAAKVKLSKECALFPGQVILLGYGRPSMGEGQCRKLF
jgi:hypothetical protein